MQSTRYAPWPSHGLTRLAAVIAILLPGASGETIPGVHIYTGAINAQFGAEVIPSVQRSCSEIQRTRNARYLKGSPALQLCDCSFGVTAEGVGDDREAQQLDVGHVACQIRPGELIQLVPALGMQPSPGQAQTAIPLACPV